MLVINFFPCTLIRNVDTVCNVAALGSVFVFFAPVELFFTI